MRGSGGEALYEDPNNGVEGDYFSPPPEGVGKRGCLKNNLRGRGRGRWVLVIGILRCTQKAKNVEATFMEIMILQTNTT